MKNRAVGIIVCDEKILVVKRIKKGKEYFVLPGGGIEEGESAFDALIRELKEELGLNIISADKVFSIDNEDRIEHYYKVKEFTGEPILGGEEKERMNEDNQYYPEWIEIDKCELLSNFYPKEAQEKICEIGSIF